MILRTAQMVMEYMEGGSLSQTVSKFQLEEAQICYVTMQILRGLRSMHGKGFAHRDLKSANIMLSIHGDIKISMSSVFLSLLCQLTRNKLTLVSALK